MKKNQKNKKFYARDVYGLSLDDGKAFDALLNQNIDMIDSYLYFEQEDHIHFIIRFNQPVILDTVCYALNCLSCDACNNIISTYRYLSHHCINVVPIVYNYTAFRCLD